MSQHSTEYENTLSFNAVTRKLHTNKHRLVLDLLQKYNKKSPLKILDIGCGPCQIFPKLKAQFPNLSYTGIEPMTELYNAAAKNFSNIPGFEIKQALAQEILPSIKQVDVILALDSLEHMPFNYRAIVLDLISQVEFKDFFINVPNEVGPAILIKNYGSMIMRYVRHKEYTQKETWLAAMYQLHKIPRHYDGHKGFDWRMLHQMLHFYFNYIKIYTSPNQIIPKSVTPSIFFHCAK